MQRIGKNPRIVLYKSRIKLCTSVNPSVNCKLLLVAIVPILIGFDEKRHGTRPQRVTGANVSEEYSSISTDVLACSKTRLNFFQRLEFKEAFEEFDKVSSWPRITMQFC